MVVKNDYQLQWWFLFISSVPINSVMVLVERRPQVQFVISFLFVVINACFIVGTSLFIAGLKGECVVSIGINRVEVSLVATGR